MIIRIIFYEFYNFENFAERFNESVSLSNMLNDIYGIF